MYIHVHVYAFNTSATQPDYTHAFNTVATIMIECTHQLLKYNWSRTVLPSGGPCWCWWRTAGWTWPDAALSGSPVPCTSCSGEVIGGHTKCFPYEGPHKLTRVWLKRTKPVIMHMYIYNYMYMNVIFNFQTNEKALKCKPRPLPTHASITCRTCTCTVPPT